MTSENASAFSGALQELPQVSAQLYAEVASHGNEHMAQRFTEMAMKQPEYVGELVRGMESNADYTVRALLASTLLIGMSDRTHGAQPDQASFKEVTQMAGGFNRLYAPVATQRPDLAIAITRAALNEPVMPLFVRDHVTTAFSNATFALLRSRPTETMELLETMVRRAQEPGSAFMSGITRGKVADNLATVSDLYPAHYGNKVPVAITGGSISIPANVALVVVDAVQQLTSSPLLQRKMEKRAKEIGLRLGS